MLRSFRVELPARAEGFPLGLPFLRELGEVAVGRAVTLFAGPNGSGKSTLLEALAMKTRLPAIGSVAAHADPTLEGLEPLVKALRLSWSVRVRRGFFMRAEDVFGFLLALRDEKTRLKAELSAAEIRLEGSSDYAKRLGLGPLRGSVAALSNRYGENPDARSHGETFLHLFRERLAPGGLYLMDEPEAALSPESQLALLTLMSDAVATGSQFVIATHSPLLLAIPGATILDFDDDRVRVSAWAELASVRLWKELLEAPERYLRYIWDSDAGGT